MQHPRAQELSVLVSDVVDVVAHLTAAPASSPAPVDGPTLIEAALTGLDDAWRAPDAEAADAMAYEAERLAVAGMAFLEGDAPTTEQLTTAPDAPGALPS